ncbi:tripartite tricarboxylate transporter TctB family protein [Microvirga makkahensis]|uniref:Tripartite tricarboxylate transporter TctB family protein n=1 Tax=Microvirga makkahensis TaxID=1128670 RepID=A0A7X3SN32_9HYPH|nr:tripartite tricarboxylate transporter TctB family protein [Microvirga makkahensis]MXQ10865.1 tripartite tricarboxylate transporter TctB family protein [Microvirga makkahensis]
MSHVLQKKDFWAGVLYVAFGAAAFWIGRDYPMGTAGRMGAGYFPTALSVILMLIGLISAARALTQEGEAVGAVSWKSLALVVGSTALFGLLLPTTGLVIALVVLILISATASQNFRLDLKAAAGLIILVTFCSLVFVKALGVPMPLVGSWFGE